MSDPTKASNARVDGLEKRISKLEGEPVPVRNTLLDAGFRAFPDDAKIRLVSPAADQPRRPESKGIRREFWSGGSKGMGDVTWIEADASGLVISGDSDTIPTDRVPMFIATIAEVWEEWTSGRIEAAKTNPPPRACPQCGSSGAIGLSGTFNVGYHVFCMCGLKGPSRDSEHEARDAFHGMMR
jgi:hypothetical protein